MLHCKIKENGWKKRGALSRSATCYKISVWQCVALQEKSIPS